MAVYVDNWRQPATVGPVRDRWSHLLADTEDELHAFARLLGLRPAWFQRSRRHPAFDHYDVTEDLRREAIRLGAAAISWRQAGRMLRHRRRAHPSGRPAAGRPSP